jgi:Fe-S-cluster containining protein
MLVIRQLEEFLNFRDVLDQEISGLTQLHAPHMACKNGCDKCCLDFKVFPVEYFAIKQSLGLSDAVAMPESDKLEADEIKPCAFLHNHSCSIYSYRPIICRTHGLPLLNMNENGDGWELSFCELNFLETDDDEFDEDNVLMEDTVNSKLFQINSRFLEANPQLPFSKTDLVPFNTMASLLSSR